MLSERQAIHFLHLMRDSGTLPYSLTLLISQINNIGAAKHLALELPSQPDF